MIIELWRYYDSDRIRPNLTDLNNNHQKQPLYF